MRVGEVSNCKQCTGEFALTSTSQKFCRPECGRDWHLLNPVLAKRVCKECKEPKSITDFTLRDATGTYMHTCKECLGKRSKSKDEEARKRRDNAAFKLNSRRRDLRAKYGMTPEEFEVLNKAQHGKCAICKFPGYDHRNSRLCVDHDHITGEIRGLLCRQCNSGIGLLKDDPKTMVSALRYLGDKEVIRDFVNEQSCLWAEDLL